MTIYTDMKKTNGGLRRHQGEIGIEIETEGLRAYDLPALAFWNAHVDGSLRGPMPMEYSLKNPLSFQQVPEALQEFHDKVGSKFQFDENSITTSTHVHLNVMNEKWITLGNFLTIYSLVENLLIRFSGENRLSNCFCLPICDAEETYRNILHIWERVERGRYDFRFGQDQTKYAALNLAALNTFGSLELRSFRGTTDIKLIQTWVDILYSIMRYSRQNITPMTFIMQWKDRGPEVLTDIFGPQRELLRHKKEDELLDQNFWYAASIASSIKDWTKIDREAKKPKVKDINALLDKFAREIFGRVFDELQEHDKAVVLQIAKNEADVEEAQRDIVDDDMQAIAGDRPINWDQIQVEMNAAPRRPARVDNPFIVPEPARNNMRIEIEED